MSKHAGTGPVGGLYDAPHGAVCARLLPYVMEANVRALEERSPSSPALARYREAAAILTGDTGARVADGVAWMRALSNELAIPGFAGYGVKERDFPEIVAKAIPSSSMKGNPIDLTESELTTVLIQAL
jgi:alcohol dehydrogenase class IV